MLDFEAALAHAEAKAGLIPASAATSIAASCDAAKFDLNTLAAAAPHSGNLAIPLVKQLTTLVAQLDPNAAHFVHWGATSQDVIDTGLCLQVCRANIAVLEDLDLLCDALVKISIEHRLTPIAARTLLQQALPTSFGFIVAGWLDALLRGRARILALQESALVL